MLWIPHFSCFYGSCIPPNCVVVLVVWSSCFLKALFFLFFFLFLSEQFCDLPNNDYYPTRVFSYCNLTRVFKILYFLLEIIYRLYFLFSDKKQLPLLVWITFAKYFLRAEKNQYFTIGHTKLSTMEIFQYLIPTQLWY